MFLGIEMNGKYKFYALWTCGCVLSERAFKEVESDTCHSCGTKFEKEDIIIINAEGEDLELMEKNMEIRREKLKKLRKEKKDKKNSEKRKADNADPFAIPRKLPGESLEDDTKNEAKKKKLSKDDCKKEKSSKVNGKDLPSKKASSSFTSSKSDAIDKKQSKVYKSLFTSSENKQDKDKQAHWVTYNPYHL